MCDFCDELTGVGRGEFGRRHPSLEHRAAWLGPEFAVLPTLGKLAPGHMLLVPRRHWTSFAAAPVALQREAETLVLRMDQRCRAAGRRLLWFEHGSSGPGSSGGCGVVHAHLHALSVAAKVRRPALPAGLDWRRVESPEWLGTVPVCSDYLMVGCGDEIWHTPAARIPSQMLRRWIAPAVGTRAWDWRSAGPDPDMSEEIDAARRMRDALLPQSAVAAA